ARTSLLAVVILIVAGAIGSNYPGSSVRLLAVKAAVCGIIWLIAYNVIPGEDRVLLRDGVDRIRRRLTTRTAPRDETA
ncbi:MAG TPA: hypothetical protein VIG47_08840, partial [Gemmatimonadaceae bacterium]